MGDVSKVKDMEGMFEHASVFNQNLDAWDVRAVDSISAMFRRAWAFNQDLGTWDLSQKPLRRKMFQKGGAFNQNFFSWGWPCKHSYYCYDYFFEKAPRNGAPLGSDF